jgi:hypothetical protein
MIPVATSPLTCTQANRALVTIGVSPARALRAIDDARRDGDTELWGAVLTHTGRDWFTITPATEEN